MEEGSANVFADLGFPNPEEHLQKAQLLHRIDTLLRARGLLLKERGLTQSQAAEVLGIDQPSLSRLLRGAVRGFSLKKLMQFLAQLDQHVLIVVTPKSHAAGVVRVNLSSATADGPSLVVRVTPSTRTTPARRRPVRATQAPSRQRLGAHTRPRSSSA